MSNLAELNFDANTVAPNAGFEPLPVGEYVAALIDSEVKPTNAGTGTYMKCQFEVLEGEAKGRRIFGQITLTNPNAEAVKIGRGDLSALCRAVGVMTPKDTAELHNRPLVLTVGMKKRSDVGHEGEMQNVIKKYAPAGNVQGVVTNGSSKPASTAAPAAAPWVK